MKMGILRNAVKRGADLDIFWRGHRHEVKCMLVPEVLERPL
jgi:hypothetical protein